MQNVRASTELLLSKTRSESIEKYSLKAQQSDHQTMSRR